MATDQTRADWAARVQQYAEYSAHKNRPFAEHLVGLVAPRPGEQVLDVATGPGVAAVAAARAIGNGDGVLATDLVADWEPYVAAAAREAGVALAFRPMPGEALDLPDASVHVVISPFGLMLMPEPDRALREIRRVLRPGGRLGVAVWSTGDRVGHFIPMRIMQSMLPPSDEPAPPGPLSLSAPGLIERLVAEAGFEQVRSERHTEAYAQEDPEADWRRMTGEGGIMAGPALARLTGEQRARMHDEVIAAYESFRGEDGTIRIPSEAIFVTARKPSA